MTALARILISSSIGLAPRDGVLTIHCTLFSSIMSRTFGLPFDILKIASQPIALSRSIVLVPRVA